MKHQGTYTDDWPAIALAAKQAAGWKCQNCGHPHDYATGYVLTVHHLNGDKSDNRPGNRLVCCQRCHLHIQGTYHPDMMFLPGMEPEWLK